MLLGLRMMEDSAKLAFIEELELKPKGDIDQTFYSHYFGTLTLKT